MADQGNELPHEELEAAWNDSSTSKQVEMDALLARMWQEIEDRRAARRLQREEDMKRKEDEEAEEVEKKEEG